MNTRGPRESSSLSPTRDGTPCDVTSSRIIRSEDDAYLVEGLRARSPGPFTELMDAYRWKVYRIAFRFTKDHHEAEDIVQETFLRAFVAGPRFRGDASLGTWLHIIATNIARNRYRYWQRRKRHAMVSMDDTSWPTRRDDVEMADEW